MDSLLELSGAAAGESTISSSLSGFEMAAALLEPRPSHTNPSTITPVKSVTCSHDESHQELSPHTTHLTEDLDTLIDQELETMLQHPQTSVTTPISPLLPSESVPHHDDDPPNPRVAREAFLDVENDCILGKIDDAQRNSSPINDLSLQGGSLPQESGVSVDYSHLTSHSTHAAPRSSAFKAYSRTDQFPKQISANVRHSQSLNTLWNIHAPDFKPYTIGPAFITPVVHAPNPWITNPTPISQWMPSCALGLAPLKPSATVPKSWMLSPQNRLKLDGPVLVLLRGAPGSGKSTLARALLENNPGGTVLSTDDYFTQTGVYLFEPHLLGEAHAWNHQRAKEAFEKGLTPIIIDNTNLQCWEMKPYVSLAQKHKYRVLFREPNTWWKTKPRELEKCTKHGVTKEKIRRMLENQDRYVSVQTIMASQPKSTALYGVDVDQTHPTEQPSASHPDLVGDSGLGKPGSYLSSSLPDVSTVDCKSSSNSTNMGATDSNFGSDGSKECMSSEENVVELTGGPSAVLLDGTELDWEPDASMTVSGQKDCKINEDLGHLEGRILERPVMFAESIGQRVKRVREQTRTGYGDTSAPTCDFSDSVSKACEDDTGDDYTGDAVNAVLSAEQLNFVGDWPAEILEQRGQWSQTMTNPNEGISSSEEDATESDCRLVGPLNSDTPNKTEFQKLLDLLQGDNNQITKEITKDIQAVESDGHQSSLVTKALPVLPDCVLDWKFERSTDPGNISRTPSPIDELEESQDASSKGVIKEACSDVHTPTNGVICLEMSSEQKDKPNHNTNPSLSSVADVEYSPETSQEKRRVSSRKGGKSCKLALTFTHQSPSSYPPSGSPVTSVQQSEPNPSPELLFKAYPSAFAQTEPQDFAVLWRIDQKKSSEPELGSYTRGTVILEGNPLRFVPKISKEKSCEQPVIPYRVCHEKSSQVEENDLRELPFKQQSLEILSHHFKHVPKETLEDLYEKCHQDMEWTTNLLLDSGEYLCRDDVENVFDHQDTEAHDLVQSCKEESCDNPLTRDLFEPIINCTGDTVIGETDRSCSENLAIMVPSNNSFAMSIDHAEHEDSNDQMVKLLAHQPEEPGERETLRSVPGPSVLLPSSEADGENKVLNSSLQQESESEFLQTETLRHFEKCLKDELEDDGETKEVVEVIMMSLLEEMERKKEEQRKEREKERKAQRKNGPMNIQTLELKLTTELALQLTELFGPVGISPGEFSPENCSVVMDLNLAKLLHQKWKDTIQEKHRQAALTYHLLEESSVPWGESQLATIGLSDTAVNFLTGTDGYSSLSNQSGVQDGIPFMDHWKVSRPPVSLRDIMLEEQVLQDSLEKFRLSRWDLDKKDGAAVVKEKQLFALFPTIDRHFLRDIFRDNNYSLEQTEQFLHTLLDDEPVRTVVASESVLENKDKCRAPSKERKQKNEIEAAALFQDVEDPEYEDFRTEATLQRQRQQESFHKADEAYRQGRKDVASFYAQQGHLHGQKMKEANHRAAVQIFERVNSTLLPQNVLDLHGLHVNEALHHLEQVLANKTLEWQQGLCRPQLSVITGRGNHSQGGVARIRPAVLDYLKCHHYQYTEPKMGLVIVMLH